MKKGILVFVFLILAAGTQPAYSNMTLGDYQLASGIDSVVAPIVRSPSATYPGDQQVGMIVYDIVSHRFKGLDDTGNWDVLSAPNGNPVVSGGTSEGLERVQLDVSVACSSSPCTLMSNTSGITSVTRASTGIYDINFTAGTYSNPPTCVAIGSSFSMQHYDATTTSAWRLRLLSSGGSPTDGNFNVICMGPK